MHMGRPEKSHPSSVRQRNRDSIYIPSILGLPSIWPWADLLPLIICCHTLVHTFLPNMHAHWMWSRLHTRLYQVCHTPHTPHSMTYSGEAPEMGSSHRAQRTCIGFTPALFILLLPFALLMQQKHVHPEETGKEEKSSFSLCSQKWNRYLVMRLWKAMRWWTSCNLCHEFFDTIVFLDSGQAWLDINLANPQEKSQINMPSFS